MAELLQAPMVNHEMTSTTFDLPGYRAVRSLGVVRGIVVRSPKFLKQFTASFSVLFGGEITQYVQVAEESRHQALVRMLQHAGEMGANAVLGVRYDTNEMGQSTIEVLAYGTAVVVEAV